jgi:hypothetical protein
MPSFSKPTTRQTINPALPITGRGSDPGMRSLHTLQANAYASDLTPEGAVARDVYYTRFPDRLHFLEAARAELVAQGKPTDLDAEEQRKASKEEGEVDDTSMKDETEVEQTSIKEEDEVASPITRSTTSRTSVPPHLRNGTASPANATSLGANTPPHLRKAGGQSTTVSPAAIPSAAPNTPQQTIESEAQNSSAISRPCSGSSASTNSTSISIPTPAQQARNTRIATAIAAANAANIRPGTLSIMFQDSDGGFLGTRSAAIDAPVHANIHITSRHAEFNPLDLADEMGALAALMRLKIDGVKLKRGGEDGSMWGESK